MQKSSVANGQLLEYDYINFNVDEILKKYWLEGSMYMGCMIHQMNITHILGNNLQATSIIVFLLVFIPMLLENFIAKKHALGLT